MKDGKYQICTRCIMDTSDPDIEFEENGMCSHCKNFERNLKKGWFPNQEGRKKLESIFFKIKIECAKKDYDCIIGLSGGVDSSYLAYVIRTDYDLRPLAVHVDGGWDLEIAAKNIENIVKKLNIDLYTYVVNWEEMRDLQVAFLRSGLANIDVPQDHVFFAKLYEHAVKNDIRYVLHGGNIATESILPKTWAYNAMDLRHLKSIHNRFGRRELNSFPTVNFFQYYIYYPFIKGMKVIKPLNYIQYKKEDAIKIMEKELGFRYYGGKHFESIFTKFQQAYYRPVKFGYEERRAYLSSLILSGQITREYALNEMEKDIYTEKELTEDKDFVIKKLGLSEKDFDEIMALPNKTFKDYPSNHLLFEVKDRLKGILNRLMLFGS